MNDFTKKELIALEDAMRHMQELHPTQNGKYPLREKLESLIDNYCEHKYEEDAHHMDIYLCLECGRREWWENI